MPQPGKALREPKTCPEQEEADCQFPPQQPDTNLCSVTTYDGLGRQISSKDGLGNITTYEYDSLGRLITTTRTLDGQPVVSVTGYDALGRRVSQTNAENHTTYFLYDNLGRLIAGRSPEGVTNSTGYDAAGRAIATTDNLGHTTRTAYDDLGRVISTTTAAGDTTIYEYDGVGNQVARIDAEGVRTTTQYDGLNRRVAVIQNDTGGGQTADSNVLTEYVYDALGNGVVITNARGFTSTFTVYDDLNRAIVVEDALGNRTTTQYNALGHRTVMTDGNDAVTTYEYDGLNRLAAVHYETDNETVAYSYDALGNRQVMTDSAGMTRYEYDDLYRLITVTTPFTGTVIYGYDLVGNRNQITYPDGKVVTYTHDGDNRLFQVFDWDEGVTTYEYDAAGRLVSTLLPNGVETTETYDAASRLIRRTHTDTISGTLHADYIYELDGLGNHQVVTETIRPPGGGSPETTVVTYTYDSLYRLTQAAYSGVLSGAYEYEYDAAGNRTQFTTNVTATQAISYTYDAANRLVESVDLDSSQVTTYEWDDAGRLITTTVGGNVSRVYSYSQDGDLIQAVVEGTTTTFVYDGTGNRLQMSVEGTVTTYTLDYAGGSRVLFEEGGAFSDTKHYLYGLACLGEHVDADEPANEEWRYYQRDDNPSAISGLVGSGLVRQTSDENRQITMAWTYSPTGGVVLGEGGPVTNLDCGNGGVYDWSTGLIFKNGRYFDPTTGIWITMGAVVTWQIWPKENRRQRRWRKRYGQQIGPFMLLLLLILIATTLPGCVACNGVPTPGTPTVPPTLPPIGTPTPGQPSPTPQPPSPTPGQPSPTPQPPPADTPQPPMPPTVPPTPQPPAPTSVQINVEPTGSNPYQYDTHSGQIRVNYHEQFRKYGPPSILKASAPSGVVTIKYTAPKLSFPTLEQLEATNPNQDILRYDPNKPYGEGWRYYSKSVWDGLNDLDVYTRVVAAEVGDQIWSTELADLTGIAMAYVIRNRAAPGTNYKDVALAPGQFAFSLNILEKDEEGRIISGGDSVIAATTWANIATTDSQRIQYQHSLSYVVAVTNDWIHDPSHGARYTYGRGGYTYFGSVSGEYDQYMLPYWP